MLPKIDKPIYKIEIPSLKKEEPFRPFLVKEEKLLLMAKDSEDQSDILSAINQVVNNCSLNPNLKIDELTLFDLEYIFLKLRSFSVNNIVKMSITDYEDGKEHEVEIDLNSVSVFFPENNNKTIEINKKTGLIMKYPSARLYKDKDFLNITDEYLFELMIRCVDKIYDGDQVFESSDYTPKQIGEFLENLDLKTFNKIKEFLDSTPKLKHVINYKNSLGNEKKVELNSLNDFFTWR